jgi:beta-glucosidase
MHLEETVKIPKINKVALCVLPLFVAACNQDNGSTAAGSGHSTGQNTPPTVANNTPPANNNPPATTSPGTFVAPNVADVRANALVAEMTIEEKISLIHSDVQNYQFPGGGAGHIPGIPRLNIPAWSMSDSSTGSGSGWYPSTVFPATIGIAASWDTNLSYAYGVEVAKQLRAQGFAMGLGGGTNMVRDPRAGRIFEYLGEDPLLSGEMLAARTNGTQSQKVIATIKHYVGNEQENWRSSGISTIDERTLREIYVMPFQIATQHSDPGSVMCSYNMLTVSSSPPGTWACENVHTLTDILKKDIGFKGQVQSDWGATHSTVAAANAGLDEEEDVANTKYFTLPTIWQYLASGAIPQARLDDMVERKLRTMIQVGVMDDPPPDNTVAGFTPQIDYLAASVTAQHFAEQSIVLLKNSSSQAPLDPTKKVLPLNAATLKNIAVIGSHADDAVLSGGGSGEVRNPVWGQYTNCGNVQFGYWGTGCEWWTIPWKYAAQTSLPANPNGPRLSIVAAIQAAAQNATVTYGGHSDHNDPFRSYTSAEIADAVAKAQAADVAIVVVNQITGEDTDLNSLSLSNYEWNYTPNNQEAMIAAVAAVNKNTIVVIESANPVLMPWISNVSAVVDAFYPGESGGPAIANILFGIVNPSAKLPITFPVADNNTPTGGGSFIQWPNYVEGLQVGYRWYDANDPKGAGVLFPFGFGLSYTSYAYANLKVNAASDGTKTVTFDVTNTGAVAGQEVAQVYIAHPLSAAEPPQRLVGWQKVALQPNETKTVSITVDPFTQSIYDVAKPGWRMVEPANVMVGASSRDIRLKLH